MKTLLFDFGDDDPKTLQALDGESAVVLKRAKRKTLAVSAAATLTESVENTNKSESEKVLIAVPESVLELTLRIKEVVEIGFSEVYVVGEVSNFSRPRSGHVYFTLKDKGAGIPAIMWQSVYSRLRFQIEEGMELVCRGRVEIYPPQGRYQLILTKVEPKGIGGLELAFRQLRERLEGQGLFDKLRKKLLPDFVKNIALITSPTGAAVRDFLQVLRRRTLLVDVLLVPVQVQGEGAALEIVSAIAAVHEIAQRRNIDCIVIVRGGGSVEDLWTFNEEIVVRAVADSRIPVVTGIGHEIDFTLCDLAADVRALTPSEAAERVAVKDAELWERLTQCEEIIDRNIDGKLSDYREQLDYWGKYPAIVEPQYIIENKKILFGQLETRLNESLDNRVQMLRQRLERNVMSVEALSPLATLARGYSITETENGKTIKSINDVKPTDTIKTRLKDGNIKSIVG
ncbi:MAG: exodeoxyribonuclease VII large subunit [Planctomycetaceae bacterium]|jgi:exodeoxyribonuclease VII large subunit|nr:exodeoxyribonuclease VII large subunit [Planctomycetaceae bacterium]